MRWPWSNDDDSRRQPQPPILSLEYWSDPKNYLTARVLIPASILAAGSLGLIHVYRAYVRRIPESSQIYPSFFRKRSLFGKVTSVGDGDNFRLYHTPGGRLQGWEWFPRRKVPTDSKELKDRTVRNWIASAHKSPYVDVLYCFEYVDVTIYQCCSIRFLTIPRPDYAMTYSDIC